MGLRSHTGSFALWGGGQWYLDHGDLVGQETVAYDHIALGDVQPFLCHTGGHQEVQCAEPELPDHFLLLLLWGEEEVDGTQWWLLLTPPPWVQPCDYGPQIPTCVSKTPRISPLPQ